MFVKTFKVQINVPVLKNGGIHVRTFSAEAESANTAHLRAVVGTTLWLNDLEGYDFLPNISVVSTDKFFNAPAEESREGNDKPRPIFPFAEDCNGLEPLPHTHLAHPVWSFAPVGMWQNGAVESETNKRTKVLPFHTGAERGSSAPIKLEPTLKNI